MDALAFGNKTTDASVHVTTFFGKTKASDARALQENYKSQDTGKSCNTYDVDDQVFATRAMRHALEQV